jgi:hypothetical protein
MGKKPFALALLVLALTLSAATVSLAQGTTSRVTGTITDTSGAAIAGATVTLTNTGTGQTITAQTSESGAYAFDLIQIGTYNVSVEKQGFKRLVSKNNVVNVNQPATVNAALEVGDVSATVEVQSTVEQVQTSTSGNIGSTVERRTLESLPIVGTRGRNPLDLLNFQPGVVSGINSAGGGVSVHGSRDRAFNFTLDGIDINESTFGGSNSTPLKPNPDSLQEMQIVTSNFTAELGRSSGAQVSLVTKSGTNRLTGNVFEFYRTPRLNANEYENNVNGRPKPQLVQHIFGGSVGGPIIKNKFFFFTNLQMLRANDSSPVTRIVYTQSVRDGIFRYVRGGTNAPAGVAPPAVSSVDAAGNPLFQPCSGVLTTGCIATYNINANSNTGAGTGNPTATGLDPALISIIRGMPLPNNFSSGDGLNTAGFSFNSPAIEKQYDFVSKFDYKFNDRNLLYVRYGQGSQNSYGDGVNGGRPIFPDSPRVVDTFRSPKNLAINYRWSPSSTLTNEFIFGWSYYAFSFDTPEPDAAIPFTFINIATPNLNFSYNARSVKAWQYIDNITWVRGSHVIKGGTNVRLYNAFDDRSNVATGQIEPFVRFDPPTASYSAFSLPTTAAQGINSDDLSRLRTSISELLGRIGTYNQAFVSDPADPSKFAPAGTRWTLHTKYPEVDLYVQDTWKLFPNLTLDLGVRWEGKWTPSTKERPILAPDKPVTVGNPPANDIRFIERDLFKDDLNNFSPSVGFAWDPFKDGKTSIRANYRLSYDRFPTFLFSSSIFQNAPGNTFLGNNPTFNAQGNLLRNGLPDLTPTQTPDALRRPAAFGTGSVFVIDPNLQFPEVHEYALSIQRELFANTVLEVNYIGKHGSNLLGGYDANQVNIFATDPRCGSQTFIEAFKLAQTASNTNICLLNYLMTGSNDPNGTTLFRNSSNFSSQLLTNRNEVAAAALTLSQRTGAAGSSAPSLTANGFSPFFFQKYPQYTGGLNVIDSVDVSRYNAVEFIFKRRFARGLSYQVAYTWSKSKDTRSFDPTQTTISRGATQAAGSTAFDINDRSLNYAWSDFDRRHQLQGTYVYELPFGRKRQFGSDMPKVLDYIVGGWQLAGNILWTSGSPFTVYSGRGTFTNVVNSTADCNGCTRNIGQVVQEGSPGTTVYWFDLATRNLFKTPDAGSMGNTGRNFFVKPTYFQTDLAVSKNLRLTERFNLDLRVDIRNLTNHPSFDNPTANITSGTFGRIRDSVISGSRKMQISAKLHF